MGVYEVLTNFRVGLLHCFLYLNRGVNYNNHQRCSKDTGWVGGLAKGWFLPLFWEDLIFSLIFEIEIE